MKRIFITLSVVTLFFFACTQQNEQAQEISSDDYLAKVGNQRITSEDVKNRIAAIPDYAKQMYEGEEGIKNIVDELVKTELLYLQARKEGLHKEPEYIAKVEEYKKFSLVSLLFEKEVLSLAEVSEKDARAYYNKNKTSFALSQQVKASHILVQSKAEAEEIIKDLRRGKSFESLAREKSVDKKSAEEGGDLGFFTKGQMLPEFEAAAFTLKKGKISKPIKTQYGYHIIKVTDRKGGEIVDFQNVKDLIIQRLEQEKQEQAFNKYIDKIKNQYPVKMNEDKLKDFISSGLPEGKQ